MSRWKNLLPPGWRRRFGPEIDDLLADTEHPLRDRLDLARLALSLYGAERSQALGRTTLTAVAASGLLLTAILSAWAASNLTHGWLEIPEHWWSSLAMLPLLVTACCLRLLLRRRSSARQR